VPEFKTAEISHLRRVVQFKYLPAHLQQQFYPPARLPRGDEDNPAPASSSPSPSPALPALSDPYPPSASSSPPPSPVAADAGEDVAKDMDTVRYFLLCPTRYIQHAELFALLRKCPPFDGGKLAVPRILFVTVPSLAPTSAEQAAQWSEQYWPIAYKNTNPYGPHPSLVTRNTAEIAADAGSWLALARVAGQHMSAQCLGESVGVAIVDQTKNIPEVVMVAGDSRWRSPAGAVEPPSGMGNVMAHPVQRAIAMVAKKRLRAAGTDPTLLDRSLFCDTPLTDIEKEYYVKDNIGTSGYLCVDLDIYLTHEPCAMCSMAILHSRFRRCIFAQRMPLTGGMTADRVDGAASVSGGLQHGLFWRPSELNWKFLAWQFEEEDKSKVASIKDTLHV
jgi:tRNA-specific adenosine deaminase 3